MQLVEATARVAVCLEGGGGLKAVKPFNLRLVSECGYHGWADADADMGPSPAPHAVLSTTAAMAALLCSSKTLATTLV